MTAMLQELLASFLLNKRGRSIGQHAHSTSLKLKRPTIERVRPIGSLPLSAQSESSITLLEGSRLRFKRRTSMIQDTRLSWPVSALTTATLTLRSRSGNNLALTTMGSSSWYLGMIVAFWTWRSLANAGETPRPFHCLGCKLIKFSNANGQFEEVECRLNVWRKTIPRCVLQEAKERVTTNSIVILDCFLTSLSPRTFVGMARILRLQVAGNPLFIKIGHRDVFAGLENLRWLHLNKNYLREIHPAAFSGLKYLIQLSLQENMLPALQKSWLESLPSLQYLHFRLNRVSSLEKDLFSHNPLMRDIDLTWNKLSTLPTFVFANLPELTMLQLGAWIVTLPTFAFGGLENNHELTIILKGNPIVCNKEMCSWLMEVRRRLKDSSCVFLLRNRTMYKKVNLAHNDICDPEMQLSGFSGGGTKTIRPLLPAPGYQVDWVS